MDLSTNYMGLKLKNPVIVSSSKLTSSVDNIKRYAELGAGAIVLKSLFEEQIIADIQEKLDDHPMYYWYPSAAEHVMDLSKEHGVKEYIKLLKDAKAATDIPIIASVNCITSNEWPSFARKLEEAGADGIELNISIFPFDENIESAAIEETYFEIVQAVKEHVTIPVSVKIGPLFTNLSRMVKRLSMSGVSGIVLFNRFFRPDINIDKMTVIYDNYLSSPNEMTMPLRWIGALSNKVNCDLAASTGIHDYQDVVKMLLAGAGATQICTTIYKNGAEVIREILEGLEEWMKKNKYNSIDQIKGKILKGKEKTAGFERIQFMRKTTGKDI